RRAAAGDRPLRSVRAAAAHGSRGARSLVITRHVVLPPYVYLMISSSECPRDDVAEPRGGEAHAEGSADVRQGEHPLAIAKQGEGLVAERRHRGESAAEARAEEDAQLVVEQAAIERERHHDTEDEAPDDVHHQGARGEDVTRELLDGA